MRFCVAIMDGSGAMEMGFQNKGVIQDQPQGQAQANPSGYVVQAPPGLEYLATQDKVMIHQVLHLVEGKWAGLSLGLARARPRLGLPRPANTEIE